MLNGTVYVDAEISFVSYKYSVVSGERLNLCALESQSGTCPGNGNYKFDVQFSLPNIDDSWSWFSTGYDHKGELVLYASQRTKVLVGYCDLVFNVDVTRSRSKNPPSALIAGVGILAVSFLGLLLCCCWLDYYKHFFCGSGLEDEDYKSYKEDGLGKTNSIKDDGNDVYLDALQRRAVSPVRAMSPSRLPPGWIRVSDPNTGRLYYANPTSGESSWEPPFDLAAVGYDDGSTIGSVQQLQTLARIDSYPGPPGSEAGSVATPVRGGASPLRGTSPGRSVSPSRAASPSRSGWIKVRDPLSGRLYFANPTTGESSWESPFGGGSVAPGPPPSSPDRSQASSTASPLARMFGAARSQQSPTRQPPSGWVKVKDPATGREYYANPATGEVSWHAPTQAMI